MALPTVEVLSADQLREGKEITTDVGLVLAVIAKVRIVSRDSHVILF